MTVTINGTTGIAGTNGSAGTPAVQGEDTNTGVFFPAADTVAVSTSGTERLRIDSAGNVGVGTASPSLYTSYGLHINAPSSGNTGSELKLTKAGQANSSFIQHLSGSMGLGTEAGFMSFSTGVGGSSERARITSSGAFCFNTTGFANAVQNVQIGSVLDVGTAYKANVNGNWAASFYNQAGSVVGQIVINSGSTSYVTSSDYRLKEDVQPMVGASDRVLSLNPVNFAWKADGSRVDGFLAHEAQEIVPEAVIGTKDAVDKDGNPVYQGIDQSKLVPLLTAALQEALTKIIQLEARIAALEGV